MNSQGPVEFDATGIPLVNEFDLFANNYLKYVLVLLFYLAPLNIGLKAYDLFMVSPLIKSMAIILGFVTSLVAGIIAFLLLGIVFGKMDIAKTVFMVCFRSDISIAMALVILAVPVAVFLIRTIERTVISYKTKTSIFCVATVLLITSFAFIVEYISALRNSGVYVFTFSVIGIIYFAAISIWINIREKDTRQGQSRGD